VAELISRPGLLHVPRDAIEDIPAPSRPGGDHRVPQHVEHDLVGHQFAAVEIRLNRPPHIGLPRHVIAQQFAGGDAGDAEMRGDQRTQSPLARARGRDHQYPHVPLPGHHPHPHPPVQSAERASRIRVGGASSMSLGRKMRLD
jgi:hypothetical protein